MSHFVSKTTFQGLAVDSGEESEEEQSNVPALEDSVTSQGKPSKSALKKQAKAARLEKRQKAKAEKRQKQESPTEDPTPLPSGSAQNPVEVLSGSTTEKRLQNGSSHAPDDSAGDSDSTPPSVSDTLANSEVNTTTTKELEPALEEDEVHPVSNPSVSEKSVPQPNQLTMTQDKPRPPSEPKPDLEKAKKRQSFITRTIWTLVMIGGFIGLLLLGHAYMILLVMVCQGIVYREVTALFALTSTSKDTGSEDRADKSSKDLWSKTLNWYFFAITNYFLYGESIIYYFKHVVFVDAQLLAFATNHRIISFTLYTIGFVGFVMSLQRRHLKQQFGLFCWVHMSLMLIVVSSHFVINNILEGMIWFWVPASLVICNDVFAYIWGITLGRTPLIALSPKKTVEGFAGAFWTTMVFAVFWGTYFMQFDYMICPVQDLGVSAWNSVSCEPNPVFVWREWIMPGPMSSALSTLLRTRVTTIPYASYQIHLLFLAAFTSLVAPFGGFFASGFKRAFDIKDFGHSIPGHGGMTDRMDCQFLMGVFTYVYYSSLIRDHHVTVGSALEMIVSGLSTNEQLELIADLKKYLEGQGVIVR